MLICGKLKILTSCKHGTLIQTPCSGVRLVRELSALIGVAGLHVKSSVHLCRPQAGKSLWECSALCRPRAGKEPGSPGTKEICGSKPPQRPGMMVSLALRTMTLGEVQRRGQLPPRERKVKLSKNRLWKALNLCQRY